LSNLFTNQSINIDSIIQRNRERKRKRRREKEREREREEERKEKKTFRGIEIGLEMQRE